MRELMFVLTSIGIAAGLSNAFLFLLLVRRVGGAGSTGVLLLNSVAYQQHTEHQICMYLFICACSLS